MPPGTSIFAVGLLELDFHLTLKKKPKQTLKKNELISNILFLNILYVCFT